MRSSGRSALVVGLVAGLSLAGGCAVSPPSIPSAQASTSHSSAPVSPAASPSASASSAASPSSSSTPSAGSLAGRTIVIDPGHTGAWTSSWGYRKVPDGRGRTKACNSSGTATRGGYSEHAYNLAQADALAAVLRQRGATVLMTRTNDSTRSDSLCVNHRADLLNKRKADLMISLHADGNLGAGHRGFHVIVSTVMHGGSAVIAKSKALAADVRNALQAHTAMPRSNYIGGGTGFSFRSDLGTLNFAERPAVMVEMGNMMNATDARMFTSSAWRRTAAVALADGIGKYLD